ncbi:hypothetical protein LCGC14_1804330 [marine sediment metagenome]|uniref:Uncharacterized protein n=1 Tax=marine sediment metagenome TaxID=412755 RepID=A0A0F9JNC1_9ZZZZ
MTKQTKARYSLKRRSKNYVGLYEGDHCLAAICTKRTRGVLDAQLLLLVMNSHKDLIIILTELSKNMQTQRNNGNMVFPGWFKEPIQKIEAAIENAKPKTEKEGSGE